MFSCWSVSANLFFFFATFIFLGCHYCFHVQAFLSPSSVAFQTSSASTIQKQRNYENAKKIYSIKNFNNYRSHHHQYNNKFNDIQNYNQKRNFQTRSKRLLYAQNGKYQEPVGDDDKIKMKIFERGNNILSRFFFTATISFTSSLFFQPMDASAASTTPSNVETININTNNKKSNFISSSLFEKEEGASVFQQTELGPPSKERRQAQKEAEDKLTKTTGISVSFGEERNEKLTTLNNGINENTYNTNIGNSKSNKNDRRSLLAKNDVNSNQQEQQLVKADSKLKYSSSTSEMSSNNNGGTISREEEQKNLLLEEFQDPDRIIAKGIIQLPNRNDVIGQDTGVTTVSDSSKENAFQSNQNKRSNKRGQDNFSDNAYLSIFSPAREVEINDKRSLRDSKNDIQVSDSVETMGTPTLTLTASSLNYALENDDAALLITCYGREGGPVAAKKVSLRGLTFPYQFELTVDNLLFPQTRSTWVKDARSTDDLGISVLLDLDGQFATANENDYIGFGISKPFSIAGANLRRDAMITVQPRTGVKEYSADEIKVLGNIDFELSRQDSGAGLAQLEEKKFQAMQKEKEQQNVASSNNNKKK